MTDKSTREGAPSVGRYILIGHLVVMLPILSIILVGFVLGHSRDETQGAKVGGLIGCAVAWLYWSLAVPRWRAWALRSGADADRLQRWAA